MSQLPPPSGGLEERGRIDPVDDTNVLRSDLDVLDQDAQDRASRFPVGSDEALLHAVGKLFEVPDQSPELVALQLFTAFGFELRFQIRQRFALAARTNLELRLREQPFTIGVDHAIEMSLYLNE